MKSIEEMMIEKRISRKQLMEFAGLPKNNAKKDAFRIIVQSPSFGALLRYSNDEFLRGLAKVLAERGLKDFPELSPENNRAQFNYIREERYTFFVAQMVAIKMLETLNDPKYRQYDETLGFDRIYEETLARQKEVTP